ncbi:hypothetical protein GXP70_13580 [Paenibacillus lycopersici]|uniref:Lipoprotein n=1 Tax=Paenibacillus lycopersici TaxID=2704462 RepID=A0A6C0FUP0_9BACL|nr:hypothetical protein [Paenibacillus lycopersici]QHT60876.1 hypothetical protein GXP70_13580 [Paenibacillus lycopersici]
MLRKLALPLLTFILFVLAGCSLAACRDVFQLREDIAQAAPAQASWTTERQPGLPNITIANKPVAVDLVGYAWCSPDGDKSCTNIDLSIATETVTTVPAGAVLDVNMPAGVQSFTIVNENDGSTGVPRAVPIAKGVYRYTVHCDWSSNQGKSDYAFALEVG